MEQENGIDFKKTINRVREVIRFVLRENQRCSLLELLGNNILLSMVETAIGFWEKQIVKIRGENCWGKKTNRNQITRQYFGNQNNQAFLFKTV